LTIGIGTYPQGAKFTTPRGYAQRVAFSDILGVPSISGETYTFHPPVVPTDTYVIVFSSDWYPFSTAAYTLDHIIVESYRTVTPSPTQIPVDFTLSYLPPVDANGSTVLFLPFGVITPREYFPLPSPTVGYWVPQL